MSSRWVDEVMVQDGRDQGESGLGRWGGRYIHIYISGGGEEGGIGAWNGELSFHFIPPQEKVGPNARNRVDRYRERDPPHNQERAEDADDDVNEWDDEQPSGAQDDHQHDHRQRQRGHVPDAPNMRPQVTAVGTRVSTMHTPGAGYRVPGTVRILVCG